MLTLALQRKLYARRIEEMKISQHLPDTWFPTIEGQPTNTASSSSSHSDSSSPQEQVHSVRRRRNPDGAYTKCHTIDSAQGQEAFMVVLDACFQHCDNIGMCKPLLPAIAN